LKKSYACGAGVPAHQRCVKVAKTLLKTLSIVGIAVTTFKVLK